MILLRRYSALVFFTSIILRTYGFEQIAPESKGLQMPTTTARTTATTTSTAAKTNVTETAKKVYKQNPEIPCGLPPFVDQMPAAEREQLKKVWDGYVQGSDCGLQQAKTFEIVNKLSAEDKTRIFGPPPSMQPQTPTIISTAAVPETAIGVIPMFIRTSPPQTKRLFDTILSNDTMDENEKFSAMEKLAAKILTPNQKVDFALWLNSLKAQKAKIDARIDALSDEASETLKKITELRIRERKILQNMPPKIAAELSGLI